VLFFYNLIVRSDAALLPKVIDIAKLMEELAPTELAENWDNVGLLLGDYESLTKKIMVCLDVTRELVDEAVSNKVDLIIAHHPLIFEPLKNIRKNDYQGELIHLLIKNNISVYCAHTNLDKAEYGTDYALATRLGLTEISTLHAEEGEQKLCKIAVFIPEGHEREVFEAMAVAGAGHIGKYSHCSFSTLGIGTFLPIEGTNPFVGQIGSIESIKETRLEMAVPNSKLDNVVNAMIKAHPYEEVAYDVYHLKNRTNKHGLGRIGILPDKVRLSDFIKHICNHLNIERLDAFGDLDKEISRVAVCAGSGADMAISAKNSGADLFLTGEIKYHKALELKSIGMPVVAAGHYATEATVMYWLTERLQKITFALQYSVEILLPDTVTEPFHTLATNRGRLDF